MRGSPASRSASRLPAARLTGGYGSDSRNRQESRLSPGEGEAWQTHRGERMRVSRSLSMSSSVSYGSQRQADGPGRPDRTARQSSTNHKEGMCVFYVPRGELSMFSRVSPIRRTSRWRPLESPCLWTCKGHTTTMRLRESGLRTPSRHEEAGSLASLLLPAAVGGAARRTLQTPEAVTWRGSQPTVPMKHCLVRFGAFCDPSPSWPWRPHLSPPRPCPPLPPGGLHRAGSGGQQ